VPRSAIAFAGGSMLTTRRHLSMTAKAKNAPFENHKECGTPSRRLIVATCTEKFDDYISATPALSAFHLMPVSLY
jgi:hypothetical protein